MLKIERTENGEVLLRLYGRFEIADIEELNQLIRRELKRPLVVDLREVTLVARNVIYFLACCEAHAIELRNCPRYIREWIDKNKEETR